MKVLYNKKFTALIYITPLLLFSSIATAQCPHSGTPGTTVYDTTISFPTGTTSIPVKFPQFNPQEGMVTCVKLCVTITGIIDSLAMQNFASSAQTGTFNYIRNDQISGPGLTTPLSYNANITVGPINLTAYDGIPGAGTDFYSQSKDTIVNNKLCRTISDSTTIVQFYGSDSVAYNYDISVSTNASITGGSSSTLVLTSAFVNFHFEYCTCPAVVLPGSIHQFTVRKLPGSNAELKWKDFENEKNYYYRVEMSRTGTDFQSIGNISRQNDNEFYSFLFSMTEKGRYFFRVKQVSINNKPYYTDIKFIDTDSIFTKNFTVYPNPSNGIIGIKFADNDDSKKVLEVYNVFGQKVMEQEFVAIGSSFEKSTTLQSGVYWVRLTDVISRVSSVNQLLIK